MSVGDQSGFAQVFDYLKPSSIWNRDEDFLRALKNGDRLLFKSYFLEGYDPLSDIFVTVIARSFYESYLGVSYEATSFKSAINKCPQCGAHKDARHSSCIECSKKTNAAYIKNQNHSRRPAEDPQARPSYSRYTARRFGKYSRHPRHLPSHHLKTSSRPKIRPPGTTGLPNAYERPLKQEVSLDLPADADLPDRFIAALGELIREMKAKGKGQKRYELKEGRRTEAAGGDIFYRFPFTDKVEREDQVEIQVDQQQVEGTIVSIGSGHLVLALKKDIGDEVRSAVLLINETGLLEALKEKVEAVSKGEDYV